MAECPACGAAVDPDTIECPTCGARVEGATASFEPVDAGLAAPAVGAPSTEGPVLVVRKGPQPGERFFVDRAKLTIGRDPESDIFLNDMTVSRAHAVIEYDANVVTIADAGSLNGTYVNGTVAEKATLADGDVVQIGTFQMVYTS